MSQVRVIGGAVDWRDGSERSVLDVLEAAGDRSSGSDELAARITDWPTRYHFSPQRANLLRPLRFAPGMRVLDVGAGTGALARHVAECGASVVALEGNRERAEAAAARCRGLDVEVVSGSIAAFSDQGEGFDVVLCVGVLEHTAPDHDATLGHLRRLTRPGGVLALAIENQLGLKYLLGWAEDHLLEPWAGVEGYVGPAPVRTFSRHRLRGMLEAAGFGHQRWLFPFPDYKLPLTVLAEEAYRLPDGARFVDQLVRWPCSSEASPALRVCDDRLAHTAFLDAGIGPDVANSFLVLAGDAPPELADPAVVAWFFGGDRLGAWRSSKAFRPGEVTASDQHPAVGADGGWLRRHRPATQPRYDGPTLEQCFLAACPLGRDEAAAVLRRWWDHLRGDEAPAAPSDAPHPFRSRHTGTVLPADHLDVNLSNFVDAGGDLVYVDAEWVAPSPVDAGLVVLRALWGLAADLVRRGVAHPWPPDATVDELALALAADAGQDAAPPLLDRLRLAEADLLATVHGGLVADHLGWLTETGATAQTGARTRRTLPFTALRRRLAVAEHRLRVTEARLAEAEAEADQLRRQLLEAHDRP